MSYYKILRPLIFLLPAEKAHNLAIWALKNRVLPSPAKVKKYDSTKLDLWGITFRNPIGIAAGFDKNAEVIDSLNLHGFGFVEVGTVTPKPQAGNPKPRMFRLEEDKAVINRLGFNNKGIDYFVNNLQKRNSNVVVGTNIGKNKDSVDAAADYISSMERVYGCSDYIAINISSPNTPGLRDLQNKEQLGSFLEKILRKSSELKKIHGKKTPILLKIAPDTGSSQRADIAELLEVYKIDGLIISNTTIGERDKLLSKHANETGGLSGKPLFEESTNMIKQMYQLTDGKIPIIGVGGVASGDDAYAKIKAGASLVQAYSAFVYTGFSLVGQINDRLAELLEKDGFKHVSEAIGADLA